MSGGGTEQGPGGTGPLGGQVLGPLTLYGRPGGKGLNGGGPRGCSPGRYIVVVNIDSLLHPKTQGNTIAKIQYIYFAITTAVHSDLCDIRKYISDSQILPEQLIQNFKKLLFLKKKVQLNEIAFKGSGFTNLNKYIYLVVAY